MNRVCYSLVFIPIASDTAITQMDSNIPWTDLYVMLVLVIFHGSDASFVV